MPAIGLGTWDMGEGHAPRAQEADALRAGLDAGLVVVDTAEMYADGGAEEVVGDALAGRRDDAVLVSKVYPHNASRRGVREACERSLARLHTGHIDVYLLHWRGRHPLAETVQGFEDLVADGLIGAWGVSNLDADDLRELGQVPGGKACVTDQVLYNLTRRGPELGVLPAAAASGMSVMAYSPLEQARIFDAPGAEALTTVAARHDATAAQVALAWTIRDGNVLAIPKSASTARVRENAAALELTLTDDDLAELDRAFPAPPRQVPLETL
ncbi:Oxidoreductase, aldo/keto reductase family [Luteococcus japonicus LSP_Lj1]|uniref:Oxidoreductase, aldo/keto reductase family n=1 Tax=Luteococcus japonicus LSP_Lj1 TaxID=1255658 RepID=A0A1R4IZZ1_9ACTN|nr:Oxidoreductase, aldo/keto reductase family [Luteococcus japonicus LSP_Lj1]